MKKPLRIVLAVVLVLLIAAAGVVWWQWGNIRALYLSSQFDAESLQTEIEKNESRLDEIAAKYLEKLPEPEQPVQTETPPESGEAVGADPSVPVTSEQAPASPGSPAEQQTPAAQPQQQEPAAQPQPSSGVRAIQGDEVSEIVAEFYSLRDELLAKLDDIQQRATAEFHSYSDENAAKMDFAKMAMKYVSEATRLEVSCDDKVEKLIARLEELVKNRPEDRDLPSAIFDSYINEKELKKAWYISELEKRGLVLS